MSLLTVVGVCKVYIICKHHQVSWLDFRFSYYIIIIICIAPHLFCGLNELTHNNYTFQCGHLESAHIVEFVVYYELWWYIIL